MVGNRMAAQFGCWCVLALLLSPAPSEASDGVLDAIVKLLEVGTQFIRDNVGIQYTKAPVQTQRSVHHTKGQQYPKTSTNRPYSVLTDLSCYDASEEVLQPLQRFQSPKRTVFFLETSCKGVLNSRQACAVESAAAANPNWCVVVIFTGPLKRSFFQGTSFATLSSYPNIQFRRMHIFQFTEGSPVHNLFVRGDIANSMFAVIHSSDVLRILVLYRLGGMYLDLDTIAMKSFDPLPNNFAARENSAGFNGAVIAIGKDKIGKEFAETLLRYLGTNYQPYDWFGNGPHLITRMLRETKTCDSVDHNNNSADICEGITLFEPNSFYPILEYQMYYENYTVNETEAYTHHMVSSLGGGVKLTPDTLYARLAAIYCPNIYQLYGNEFGI